MADTDMTLKMKFGYEQTGDIWDENTQKNNYDKLINDYAENNEFTHIHTKLFCEKDLNKTSVTQLKKLLDCSYIDWNKAEMPNSRNAGLLEGDLNSEKFLAIVDALIEEAFKNTTP